MIYQQNLYSDNNQVCRTVFINGNNRQDPAIRCPDSIVRWNSQLWDTLTDEQLREIRDRAGILSRIEAIVLKVSSPLLILFLTITFVYAAPSNQTEYIPDWVYCLTVLALVLIGVVATTIVNLFFHYDIEGALVCVIEERESTTFYALDPLTPFGVLDYNDDESQPSSTPPYPNPDTEPIVQVPSVSTEFEHSEACSACPLWRSEARQQCEKIMGEAQKWLDYLDEREDGQHAKAK